MNSNDAVRVEAERDERLTRYEADVLRSADGNHIWLNAFSCIRPTDEFKIGLANQILDMLADRECTIPSSYAESFGLDQRCLVVRINKS